MSGCQNVSWETNKKNRKAARWSSRIHFPSSSHFYSNKNLIIYSKMFQPVHLLWVHEDGLGSYFSCAVPLCGFSATTYKRKASSPGHQPWWLEWRRSASPLLHVLPPQHLDSRGESGDRCLTAPSWLQAWSHPFGSVLASIVILPVTLQFYGQWTPAHLVRCWM